jgi:hypothetical protein
MIHWFQPASRRKPDAAKHVTVTGIGSDVVERRIYFNVCGSRPIDKIRNTA